jgi:acetyl esterase/lipase
MRLSRRAGAAFAIVVAFAFSSPARAADPAVVTSYDLAFSSAGGAELRMDVAQPTMGAAPYPAVVVFHSGAWREGGKDENRRLLFDLARHGYVGVSPDYRLCPRDVFPAQVEDAKAAVRFLRANAASLKVDPDRIGAMGFSAGGYLALMLGVTGPDDGFGGDKANPGSSRVQAVVDFFGPADLADGGFSATAKDFVSCYLGGSGDPVKDLAVRASPVSYVSPGDAAVLVFQGSKDALVPPAQVFALMEKLSAAGVKGRVEFLLGAEHGFRGAEYDRAMKATWEFLEERLKRK